MAGGTWNRQDKIRPGAYINYKARKKEKSYSSERGIATIPLIIPWGKEEEVMEITSENINSALGLELGEVILVREALKGASKVLVYRINKGEKAKAVLGTVNIEATYSGEKGNKITVVIQNSIDDSAKFEVITLMDTKQVDKQVVKNISEFKSNGYIELTGTGELQATAGIPLEGGTNGTVTNSDYTKYLSTIELYNFNCMGVPTTDKDVKSLVASFIKRLRDQEGQKVQAVLENYLEADYEGIISVKNGVKLNDREITSSEAVAFIAGITAGATINKSNTYAIYPGAIDVTQRYTDTEIKQALKDGEIVFTINNSKVVIEQDINTLKTYIDDKSVDYRKNRVLRVMDISNNDIKAIWNNEYIGKIDNNSDGRNLFKKDVIKYMEGNQKIGAITNFVAEDIVVDIGEEKDSVLTYADIQPTDAMEKLYMEVEVQ